MTSKAEKIRQAWMRKHHGMIVEFVRMKTRSGGIVPGNLVRVFSVDWVSANGDTVIGMCDWGQRTRIQAIQKAMRRELVRLR